MHGVIIVITVFIALVSLLYFKLLFIYSAIQPQVWNKLTVQWNPISQLEGNEGITCHMGSHSVTVHPTQVNTPHLNPSHPNTNPVVHGHESNSQTVDHESDARTTTTSSHLDRTGLASFPFDS